ncbi:MAG: hypothetical protein RLZZ162_2786 [Verrucomicrobiota bacterium]|jgi:hypothetical protein
MNDSEFIEYLNLYLDHEITPADAARLEAEVQRSPERRRIYRDYCRMQKACLLLAKDFNAEAASAGAQVRAPFEVEGARRFSWGTGVWGAAGLFAAAACVAIVFIANQNPAAGPVSRPMADLAIARPVVSVVAPALETGVIVGRSENIAAQASFGRSVTVPAPRRSELQPGLALGSLSLGTRIAGGESPAEGSLPAQFDWLSSLEIAPMQRMQLEGFRFEARPIEAANNSVYGGRPRPAQQGVVEMTAFQITK